MAVTIHSTGINCAFCIGGTKLIQSTNKDSAPCSHCGFRDLKKLKLWRCEAYSHCMGRYEPHDRLAVSLLTCHSEHAGAYGTMDGVKSLCTGSVLKSGVW